MFVLGEVLAVEGAVDGNVGEEMLGVDLMMMAQMEQQQQQQQQAAEWARQQEIRRQQAIEATRLEQIRLQQIAEQRRIEEENRQCAYRGYMGQGVVFMNAGQLPQAMDQFNLALQISPNDIFARFNIACCHEKSNDFLGAYNSFIALSNHAADLPGFSARIGNCETVLANAALTHMKNAQQLYQEGNQSGAITEINAARTFAPRSQAGQNILQQANNLTDRMQWDSMRQGVHEKFIAGKNALDNRAYEDALQTLSFCQADFAKYAAFLDVEDRAENAELPALLTKANRGVAFLRNVQAQNEINAKLPALKQALVVFDTTAAITLLGSMLDLANNITVTDDVVNLGYIPLATLNESLRALNAWQSGFETRKISNGATAARRVHDNFSDQLVNDESVFLLDTLMEVVRNQWRELDGRNLSVVTSMLRDTVNCNLEQNDFCTRCCTGANLYIVDRAALQRALAETVAANLPQEPRQPINLAMFPMQAQDMQVQPLMMSGGVPMATVVAPTSAQQMFRGEEDYELAQKGDRPGVYL
jgi:tetratricopeptide (TPR) repeat protein